MVKKLFLAMFTGFLLSVFGLISWGDLCSMKMDNATYLIVLFGLIFASFILIIGDIETRNKGEEKPEFDITSREPYF